MGSPPATAIVIAVGDELLLGEIENTNTTLLCRDLSAGGVCVLRCLVLPDDLGIIAREVNAASTAADVVVACGGIGPTPDDVTRQAVAAACGVELELNAEAVEGYQGRRGTELNAGQLEMCRLPAGCELLWSEFPSPPAFRVKNIYVLPGVPQILESVWSSISPRFRSATLHTASFLTARGESQWYGVMQQFIEKYPQLKFGSYPKMGTKWRVEIRVRGTDRELAEQAAAELERAIADCAG